MKRRTESLAMPRIDRDTREARRSCAGLTMIELIVATGVLSMVFLGVGAMMSSSATSTRLLRSEVALVTKAQEIVDVCRVIPFGNDLSEILPHSTLVELFDGDPRMGGPEVTLHGLRKTSILQAHASVIALATSDRSYFPDGFPVAGTFKIRLARAGYALFQRAVTEVPEFYSKLRSTYLDDDTALRVTVTFEDARDRTDRVLLSTIITAQHSEGAQE
jgi:hypothetical protein